MNDANIELLKKIQVHTLYFKEVLIPHLNSTITEAEIEMSVIVESFGKQFYTELLNKLQKKANLFKVYLDDLNSLKINFEEQLKFEQKTKLDSSEFEFENLLIHSIAELNIVIKTIEIEMSDIKNKIEEKSNEKSIKRDYTNGENDKRTTRSYNENIENSNSDNFLDF